MSLRDRIVNDAHKVQHRMEDMAHKVKEEVGEVAHKVPPADMHWEPHVSSRHLYFTACFFTFVILLSI